jgi:hypothetical protein
MKANSLTVFEGKQIRRYYDESTEIWYFSVMDIIQVLIQQPDYQTARKYWNKLKEGTEWGQIFILESGKNAQEEKRRTCGHKVNLIIRERCQ